MNSMKWTGRLLVTAGILALVSILTAGTAASGLGRCALCSCGGFSGGPTTNWRCVCEHHYDHHYNNKKGPM
jgi:hypothetical protein